MYEHDVYLNMSALAYCYSYNIDHEELVNKVYETIEYKKENFGEEKANSGRALVVIENGRFLFFDFEVVETDEEKNMLLISKSTGVK